MSIEQNCGDKTDEEIVSLTLGNQAYLECLIARYEKPLMAYIMRLSRVSVDDAEDILQDVFIKVYENLNGFDPSLKFSSWIYRITHNQVISSFRKLNARPEGAAVELDDELANRIAADLNITEELDNEFLREQLDAALAAINKKYREVIILKFFEEKDYTEMSDILKKPMGTIATLINRAKVQLMKELVNSNPQIDSNASNGGKIDI